jgi:AraC-like DNA-binding protein
MKKHLTTLGLPGQDKFEYWQDIVNDHFVKLTCRSNLSQMPSEFNAELNYNKLVCIDLLEVNASGQSVTRGPKRFSEDDYLLLTLQKKGAMEITQDERRTVLLPGDIGIYDSRRPYFINLKDEFQMQTLKIPFDVIDMRNFKTSQITAIKIDSNSAINFIFSNLLSNLFVMGSPKDYIEEKRIYDCFNFSLNEFLSFHSNDKADNVINESDINLYKIKDYINSNLSHSSISVDSICKELGISRSSLYRSFSSESSNISSYIWSQRTHKFKSLLNNSDYKNKTITELAFMVGFSSSSHASILFKKHFGMTPSQYRTHEKG